ncbi:MAG: hypothetical protein FWD83_05385 [Promicromonosporaceae bacterium]|nr:hypothetical protein [Promicromonosporaceae bacterium]
MLGRTKRESPTHAALAARLGGWSGVVVPEGQAPASAGVGELIELLDLGNAVDTLGTVAAIDDLAAVLHLGHPEQPTLVLEQALLSGDPALMVTSAQAVIPQWAWAGQANAANGGGVAVIDEAGMRDCADVLRSLGLSPRLVPGRMTISERVAIAGTDGTLVVERPRIPAGLVELSGSERFSSLPPIWYGLLESRATWPRFAAPAQVWLAFGPHDDYSGSLQPTLAVFAAAGLDLQHLRSHPSTLGPHVFFTSFACPNSEVLDSLTAQLADSGIAHRTLAVLPGAEFLPGPSALEPRWMP